MSRNAQPWAGVLHTGTPLGAVRRSCSPGALASVFTLEIARGHARGTRWPVEFQMLCLDARHAIVQCASRHWSRTPRKATWRQELFQKWSFGGSRDRSPQLQPRSRLVHTRGELNMQLRFRALILVVSASVAVSVSAQAQDAAATT